ncbi:MAG: hypothetical protein ACQ5SW_00165 [Sphaerochaetaceae bacterium]
MKQKLWVVLVTILLVSSLLGLFAAPTVTAEYIPEAPIYFEVSPGIFTHPTVLGAKLGTFIVTSDTGEFYSPAMVGIGEASGAIQVTGMMKDWENDLFIPNRTNDFYIFTAAYPNGFGSEPVLNVLYNNVRPVIDWGTVTITANPFYVELYLVNSNNFQNRHAQSGWRKAQYFKLDTPYSLPAGFNPQFSIAVANDPYTNVGTYTSDTGTVNESLGSYVTSNGVSGPDNTPIVGPGGFTDPDGGEGFYYGDGPTLPSYLFSFRDHTASFTLADAFGSNRVTLNEARIEVLNGETGGNYAQLLTFSDTNPTTSFMLLHEIVDDSITYQLFLGNESITKGLPLLWDNLAPGLNTKDLKIGGINANDAQSKVSGDYRDTITVNITNPN